ncbi:hypothetical protein M3Y99_00462900 [Aphelenchoides fujianensis]|nr:hypothetical protein M3Y99_00462900 [Aphelenchoides fujianensis]
MPAILCGICGAPGGNHYGGRCCPRCKTFFRRVVKQNARFSCSKDGNCEIKQNDHKCCRACRYARCFQAGLDPKLVHSDRNIDTLANRKLVKKSPTPSTTDSALVKTNLLVNSPFEGALGWKTTLKLPAPNDVRSVLAYFTAVDSFLDEFCDTGHSHTIVPVRKEVVNMGAEEAFLIAPRRLSIRSKMNWRADNWVAFSSLQGLWCRTLLNTIDWASHIPELRRLHADDQLRLVAGRYPASSILLSVHRTLMNTQKNCLLASGGQYVPFDPEEVAAAYTDEAVRRLNGHDMQDRSGFVEMMRTIGITDEEFTLFRLIVFFLPSPKLSAKGREVVRNARLHYESLLVQHMRTKHDQKAALDRIGEIFGLISQVEQLMNLHFNQMTWLLLFHLADLKGSLTHSLYIQRSFI